MTKSSHAGSGPNDPLSKILKMVLPLRPQRLSITLPLLRLRLILIKIPRISRAPQMGHNGTQMAPIIHIIPTDILEPLVLLYCSRAAFDVSESVGYVYCA